LDEEGGSGGKVEKNAGGASQFVLFTE